MWLLTTSRAQLQWFAHPPAKYAVLSHVWGTEEQSFGEVQEIERKCRADENPRNFVSDKIRCCCMWAEAHGFTFIWVDTCCIDKTSSAELSEAINSMFAWYAAATVCYVFLCDVSDGEPPSAPNSTFRKSKWFTRGWTLQELIAPKVVIFLSRTWFPIASKRSISPLLEDITGIDAAVLMGNMSLSEVSVARRMSWASARRTTRVEDEAYCLMGIFGVHLSTIYGEGKEAFLRLQEEIMRRIPDTTLFAWGPRADPVETLLGYRSVFPTSRGTDYADRSSLLASGPAAFKDCSDLVKLPEKFFAAAYDVTPRNTSFTVSSHGIQATCPVIRFSGGCALLLLPCAKAQGDQLSFVGVILRFQGEGSPWAVGTRALVEEVTLEQREASNSASLIEQLLARKLTAKTRQDHFDVRCVLLPMGFDFGTCLQRPLKRPSRSQPLAPVWEQSYVAYRLEHVISKDPRPSSPIGLQRTASLSLYYKLFFPSWVIARLELRGFMVPALAVDPAPGFNVGERLSIPFFDWRKKEQMRMELRTDIRIHASSGTRMAALWCTILLPTDTNRSLDAQMCALHGGNGSMGDRGMQKSGTAGEGGLPDNGPESANGGAIEIEAGFVDLWEHSGCKGCKEFSSGRWRLLLTFTRLCDDVGQEDADVKNVYLVDIDLSNVDV
ncbi:HET-domain-containing protein [Trametes versicolor FP-101664 SS1]|uniref:HET-domain-containing protein n=1 Tax=Trametes versicolor (strain FP-101664) TaxID=717944 RepID=UPI00046241D1|nr:HET-domain-containing protein [Trametes versicolor FP-101664 SS1]EIW62502.1 HET-domain-containing protein [Trametes versicolor FP-101664 SS1]